MSDITAMIDGGMGKDSRSAHDTKHEVHVAYDDGVEAVVARVGYYDGSDWPDRFTRAQWTQFANRVHALFDAVEHQIEL